MADSFNMIDNALSEDDAKKKVDLTGNGSGGAGGGDAIQKGTSNSGAGPSASGGTGISTQSQATGGGASGFNPARAAQAFKKLSIATPTSQLNQASSKIQTADDKLQAEANTYTQGARDATKQYDRSADIQGAASGSGPQLERVAGQLGQTQAQQYDSFKGLGTDIPSAGNLRDPNLLRGQAGAGYTSGMGAFDSALLGKNQDFQRQREQIEANERALVKKNSDEQAARTAEAQSIQQQALESENLKSRQALTGINQATLKEAEARAAAEMEKRGKLDPSKLAQGEYMGILQALQDSFRGTDPNTDMYQSLMNPQFDPSRLGQFINVDKDVSASEMMNQSQVQQFNRVLGLLGGGGQQMTYNQAGAGPAYSTDRQGAAGYLQQNLLKTYQDAQAAQKEKEQARQSGMQGVLDGFQLPGGKPMTNIPSYNPVPQPGAINMPLPAEVAGYKNNGVQDGISHQVSDKSRPPPGTLNLPLPVNVPAKAPPPKRGSSKKDPIRR